MNTSCEFHGLDLLMHSQLGQIFIYCLETNIRKLAKKSMYFVLYCEGL